MSELAIIAVTSPKENALQVQILINSFLLQTDPRWRLYVIHDGPSETCRKLVTSYDDPRIEYRESERKVGNFGNPNRKAVLSEVSSKWVTWTNCDNYHVPKFVEFLLSKGEKENLDLVFCDCLYNGDPTWEGGVQKDGRGEYNVLYFKKVALDKLYPKGLGLDFINFICRTELAREVSKPPYDGWDQAIADNLLLSELLKTYPKIKWGAVDAALAVHN